MRRLLIAGILLACAAADAKPYRAMVTRTAIRTKPGRLELGARVQSFFAGVGPSSQPYHQLAGTARWWLLPRVEANVQLEMLVNRSPFEPGAEIYFGDIPLGVQISLYDEGKVALAAFARVTIPTGPSHFNVIPPSLSDGTLDLEGTFIAEVRASRRLRLLFNAGYLHHGFRPRSSNPQNFDVPDAIRLDMALTFESSDRLLLVLEAISRFYTRPDITPAWRDNGQHVELLPGVRFEAKPGLVLESAFGIAVTPGLQQIYLWRAFLGLTYEFDL